MIITFYGTRGSTPVCESGFQEFGGNTTCVLVSGGQEGESVLVFDAGTGIRKLGKELISKKLFPGNKIYLTFSHFHWDHIQGFPFFAPAYDLNKEIEFFVIGDDAPKIDDFKEILAKQMESTYFPISIDDMGANFTFTTTKEDRISFDGGQILANKHTHPGGAHGYRLETEGKIFVYCTDLEHGEQLDPKVIEFCKNADVLIHDAQYTPQELLTRRGWGHSSWEQAIQVAELANVKQLYLTHHDPDHNDDFLRNMEKECQERFPNCFLAREGQQIKL
ncbi:MBL fold metallo-hydrolase [Aquimarina sp. AD10]|uniref:MBL fold metallo-hydrolase n=1 Tax=Aquimarina sp. AD10 TaxID=1714849 RepID=UPI000E469E95|nr:MBL fold metallo-hydrolase [Aquimarina sp. AD10]AXT63015.1 MBL fold metallo-hydrolase [Aquimarina sp. AD10]RKM96816.1 MBL fold metallo-hydrolase [Aquimarina sp. AD10]